MGSRFETTTNDLDSIDFPFRDIALHPLLRLFLAHHSYWVVTQR
jgi:hypothetical protein